MNPSSVALYTTLAALVGLAVVCFAGLYLRGRKATENNTPPDFRRFQLLSVTVFLLAMTANWFHGPKIYELYHEKYAFGQKDISILFSMGFVASAVSGLFVGNLADYFGRKASILIYVVLYMIACGVTHSSDFWVLLLGRICAGVGTSFLYFAPESWMISAHISRYGFDEKGDIMHGNLLGQTFSFSWSWNYPVAILVGIICDYVIDLPQQHSATFDCSAITLVVLGLIVFFCCEENYGDNKKGMCATFHETFVEIWSSWDIKMLCTIQTFFESTLFVFIRFWVEVCDDAISGDDNQFSKNNYSGVTFSVFMVACLLGTQLLSILKPYASKKTIATFFFILAALSNILVAADIVLVFDNLVTKILLFSIFEVCVGVYFNVMSDFRGALIDDGVRASVTAVCRVPLNLVVVGLLLSPIDKYVQFYILGALNLVAAAAAVALGCIEAPKASDGALVSDKTSAV